MKTYHSSDIFGKNSIDMKKINKALIKNFCKYIMFLLMILISLAR